MVPLIRMALRQEVLRFFYSLGMGGVTLLLNGKDDVNDPRLGDVELVVIV